MYCEYFRFQTMPFENTPDPRFFFVTAEHEEAFAALKYGVTQRRGITLVTGPPGSGKTLLGRMLVQSLGDQVRAAVISHTPDDAHDFLMSLCRAFEVRVRESRSTGELVARLEAMLMEGHREQALCLALVDEAQTLSIRLLGHLRMLTNLEVDSAKLLQVILLGQPALGATLRRPRLNHLRQRIFCSRALGPLARDQTGDYIRHRLKIAGARDVDLFTDEAVDLIHERSGGLPRMINQMADNALLTAYGASRTRIDRQTVAESIDQMMRLQVAPSLEATDARAVAPRRAPTDMVHTSRSRTAEVEALDERLAAAREAAASLTDLCEQVDRTQQRCSRRVHEQVERLNKTIERGILEVKSVIETCRSTAAVITAERSTAEGLLGRLLVASERIKEAGKEAVRQSRRAILRSDHTRRALIATRQQSEAALHGRLDRARCGRRGVAAASAETGDLENVADLLQQFARETVALCDIHGRSLDSLRTRMTTSH